MLDHNIVTQKDVYKLLSPTVAQLIKMLRDVNKLVKEGRDAEKRINYTVITLFSGHGFVKNSSQHYLLNEFCSREKYYKSVKIEAILRTMAKNCMNSYIISIFACCRIVYDEITMTGFIPNQNGKQVIL